MPHLLPRRRRTRILLAIVGLFALYLVALSAVPALLHRGEDAGARRERALRAIRAANWSLVPPEERAALARAVDDTWRALRTYRMRYVTGRPEDLAVGRFESEATSAFRLDGHGRVLAQRDTSFISAVSPASGGREERVEGYRILTAEPYLNSKGRRVANAELIYQRALPGAWTCQRVASDRQPPPGPGLDLGPAGDAGFAEIDGHPVRGFIVPVGAFGLRSPATVWIDTETLHLRRQETESVLPGRREVWTYSDFDAPVEVQPPAGVPCVTD
jgi:hypothetical protein